MVDFVCTCECHKKGMPVEKNGTEQDPETSQIEQEESESDVST